MIESQVTARTAEKPFWDEIISRSLPVPFVETVWFAIPEKCFEIINFSSAYFFFVFTSLCFISGPFSLPGLKSIRLASEQNFVSNAGLNWWFRFTWMTVCNYALFKYNQNSAAEFPSKHMHTHIREPLVSSYTSALFLD